MNHPRIETSKLSDTAIKGIAAVLLEDYYRFKQALALSESPSDKAGIIATMRSTMQEHQKIQRFLDR
jgi:hypothetical protein